MPRILLLSSPRSSAPPISLRMCSFVFQYSHNIFRTFPSIMAPENLALLNFTILMQFSPLFPRNLCYLAFTFPSNSTFQMGRDSLGKMKNTVRVVNLIGGSFLLE